VTVSYDSLHDFVFPFLAVVCCHQTIHHNDDQQQTQMTRTFLFLYVFTVPFVLLNDASSLSAHCFIVFLLTYGFVGLEVVSIELDNPFGNDANDFNNSAMAVETYEDCYLTILDVDGPDWTDKLYARMQPSLLTTPGMSSEGTPLL
jgi:hypothetical protein